MRTSIAACVLGALGGLFGGWLVARWCLGVVVIAESALLMWWAFERDDGEGPAVRSVPGQPATLAEVLERARVS